MSVLRVEVLNKSLGVSDLSATFFESCMSMRRQMERAIVIVIVHEEGGIEVGIRVHLEVEGIGEWAMLKLLEESGIVEETRSHAV